MKIAVTGATGFIGHYIVRHLAGRGHTCRCWYRTERSRSTLEDVGQSIEWIRGELMDESATAALVERTDAVVHGAFHRPGLGFRGAEGDIPEFVRVNVVGTLKLMEAARTSGAGRFVFISTCAVHEIILEDRALDEAHPMWPTSYYGAHKAAIEEFVYAYGLKNGYNICALRPTGVYGLHHKPRDSKWYELVHAVAQGDLSLVTAKGGKEVHAADVARAVDVLLTADGIAGQAYNCYDRYVSLEQVAQIAARLSGQKVHVEQTHAGPKHQIDTSKIRALGMEFGGMPLLEQTVAQLLNA